MIKARGFTLMEAVAVIVVTGIIASVVALFIAKPVEGYVDTVRRAALSDIADGALRRIARDVRAALPNSLRKTGACGTSACYVEFIPTRDGVRYRVESKPDGTGDVADFQPSTGNSFEIFSNGTPTASNGDYVVIFNTKQCSNSGCTGTAACLGADAYEGCNRRTLQSFSATSMTLTSTNGFPFDSPGHRAHIVPQTGPVTYACESPSATDSAKGVTGPLVLHRYTNYATGSGAWSPVSQPTSFSSATVTLLADSISNCSFAYAPGVTQRNGLLTLALTLTRSGESVTLYHEIHVDNQP